ncbi:MAG: hypothetical protein Q9221_001887 [Calogaya cf. arnoldii]
MSSSTLSPVLLTKTQRRKKISLSSAKKRHPQSQQRSASTSASKPNDLEEPDQPSIASSAIEFKDFSYWDDEKGFVNISIEHRKALQKYLCDEYRVMDFLEAIPYLVLWCSEAALPDPIRRPFTIAGCVAVWLEEGSALPSDLSPYDLSGLDNKDLQLDDEVAKDLVPYRLPSITTLAAIGKLFPSAEYVTYYITGIVIELPSQSTEAYAAALEDQPRGFSNCCVTLGYHNGPLASTEMKRLVKPNPASFDGDADDTNYLSAQGSFNPGAMLSSTDAHQISAGILVRKADKIRLTVAFHCWEDEHKQHPDKLGDPNFCKVTQGHLATGTAIGYVAERLGSSDIGLVKLDDNIEFHNRFLDIDAEAKCLLPSNDIRMCDEFVIDGYITGAQRLKCFGVRSRNESHGREKEFQIPAGKEHMLPSDGKYVSLVQGIYATTAPIMESGPMIRARVCGSAIVQSRKAARGGNVLAEGRVAGFMQFSDLKLKSRANELLCYCEVLDEMITDGWEVVKVASKRKAEDEGEGLANKRKAGDEDEGRQ